MTGTINRSRTSLAGVDTPRVGLGCMGMSEFYGDCDDVLVATKIGIRRGDDPKRGVTIDSSPEYIRRACEESLRRLGVDRIGLLYLHRRSPQTPIEDAVGAMIDFVREGKVGHIGLCEVSKATFESACRVTPISVLQAEYSLWTGTWKMECYSSAGATGAHWWPIPHSAADFLAASCRARWVPVTSGRICRGFSPATLRPT